MRSRSAVAAVMVVSTLAMFAGDAIVTAAPQEGVRPVTEARSLGAVNGDDVSPLGQRDLGAALARANSQLRTHGGAATISAEVLTADTAGVARRIVELGGVLTGSVEGHIVQASLPVAIVDDVERLARVDSVRPARIVARPPVESMARTRQDVLAGFAPEAGTGSIVGQNVALTNAEAWQDAGIDGSVKIGVVDYFDLGLWDSMPDELGPLPDASHIFCRDSTSSPGVCSAQYNNGAIDGDGYEHGAAVVQVLLDMAPNAELYLATVATTSDLIAAVDWFASNGVRIVTRSLGAAYDGAGDGTGPLAAVVDHASTFNITWFNSGGNDARDGYARVVVPADLSATGGYVDFDNTAGIDTYLRASGACVLIDGLRWSDWSLAAADRSDYVLEAWAPSSNPDLGNPENHNPPPGSLLSLGQADAIQTNGAEPLEGVDEMVCPGNDYGFADGITYFRVRRKAGTPQVGPPDVLEFGLGSGLLEVGRSQVSYSAAKPVVDSRNPAVVAVGAVDPADGSGNPAIGPYSSQGPTNDGRIKPDVSAPSCVASGIYNPCFNGTSAASPTAAGMAALLLDAGLAAPGVPLASAIRHFTFDRNAATGNPNAPDGPDNAYGVGQLRLPNAPTAAAPVEPAAYHALTPRRLMDTRDVNAPLPAFGIVDVRVAGVSGVPANATAVAINLTSVGAPGVGFIQAAPYLRSSYGSSSTLNIATAGTTKANFAIVPVGQEGHISVYAVPGGHLIVDVLGYFAPVGEDAVSAGRFVSIVPERTLDTRTADLVPAGWVAHKPGNESIVVPSASAVPSSGVAALVLNVTATEGDAEGFARAQPTGQVPPSSTVNYGVGGDAANTVIVPVGADGTASVYTNMAAHLVVDVTGYITDESLPPDDGGLFVALAPVRGHDSRVDPAEPIPTMWARKIQLAGPTSQSPTVPVGASAVSINLTAVDQIGNGFLTAYPANTPIPPTSSLNYIAGQPIANGALIKLSPSGALNIYTNQQSHVVIDVNGFFT